MQAKMGRDGNGSLDLQEAYSCRWGICRCSGCLSVCSFYSTLDRYLTLTARRLVWGTGSKTSKCETRLCSRFGRWEISFGLSTTVIAIKQYFVCRLVHVTWMSTRLESHASTQTRGSNDGLRDDGIVKEKIQRSVAEEAKEETLMCWLDPRCGSGCDRDTGGIPSGI